MTGENTVFLVVGIIGGGIVSWLIARHFYRRSTTDLQKAVDKLWRRGGL